MTAIRRIVILTGCAFLAACAASGTGRNAAEQREPAIVIVDNQGFLDMTVYALRGAQRIRLGTAMGLSKTRFTLPRGILFGATPLRFLADPIGGTRTPVSEEITVSEGEEVVLTIPPG